MHRNMFIGLAIVATACILHNTSQPAAAQGVRNENLKILPSDGVAFDYFGFSVAISGATAIVGARNDDDNGRDAGSAYLFDVTTGAQIVKLLPSDGAAGDEFGMSVAIDGATAIVGARNDDDNGRDAGSAYLFDVTTGTQIAKLLPSDGAQDDFFGYSVAISGATAIVGAFGDDNNGRDSGSAYLFDVITGAQIAKLLPSDGAAGDLFGYSVAISGATAIVGAFGDGNNGRNSGSAYLFDVISGARIAKLLPSDGAETDYFGASVAISGSTAIVGARLDDDNGRDSGSAYLFDVTIGAQVAKLFPSDGAAGDDFGNSVAISGSTAIVGAPWDDDNGRDSGSAYLFSVEGHTLHGPWPGVAGQRNRFRVEGCPPGEDVCLVYGLEPGSVDVPGCPGIHFLIADPVYMVGCTQADAEGVAQRDIWVAEYAKGRTVRFQSYTPSTCGTSNAIDVTFE